MEQKIEGIHFHRHAWQTDEWRGGAAFLVVLAVCAWRGLSAGDVSAWLALGLNLYMVGRMLYKRGRGIMEASRGERHALGLQLAWNGLAVALRWESPQEGAMWGAVAYGVFCACRGLAKQRVK